MQKYAKKHQQRQTIPINKILEQEHFQNKFNYEKLVVGRFFRSHLVQLPLLSRFTKNYEQVENVSQENSQQCKVMLWNALLLQKHLISELYQGNKVFYI